MNTANKAQKLANEVFKNLTAITKAVDDGEMEYIEQNFWDIHRSLSDLETFCDKIKGSME